MTLPSTFRMTTVSKKGRALCVLTFVLLIFSQETGSNANSHTYPHTHTPTRRKTHPCLCIPEQNTKKKIHLETEAN